MTTHKFVNLPAEIYAAMRAVADAAEQVFDDPPTWERKHHYIEIQHALTDWETFQAAVEHWRECTRSALPRATPPAAASPPLTPRAWSVTRRRTCAHDFQDDDGVRYCVKCYWAEDVCRQDRIKR